MSQDIGIERRLAAVLAADVAGFSRLTEADEVGTMRMLATQRTILDSAISKHRGRIANTAGDSVLAEFPSAVNAVQCAVEAQQALRDAAEDTPADRRVLFRIGIHVGDVMVRDGDLLGTGVNVAARLEALADAGGIVLSAAAHEHVKKILLLAYTDLGPQSVKNIEEPVRAFAIGQASAASTVADLGKPLPLPDKPSIAVLPFQNMSGDPEQEYFADGIVEDIITALSRFKSLFVIARNSSFAYKGKSPDIRQVGRELGVGYVLEGSVRKAANRVRITGQLIDARSGRHLWADRFEGSLVDVFSLQDEVTTGVVGVIAPKIEQAEIDRAKQKPTDQLDSYDCYLRGVSLFYKRQFGPAREYFRKAYERDPEYAIAYGMAAYTFGMQQGVAGQTLTTEMKDEAIRLVKAGAALANEDPLALARCGHGLVYWGQEEERGVAMVERAVTLNPNLATAWSSLGWVSLILGKADRCIESFETFIRLSPLDPFKTVAWGGIAWAHWVEGRYDEGRAWALKATQEFAHVQSLVAYVLNTVGAENLTEARAGVQELLKLDAGFSATHALEVLGLRPPELRQKVLTAFRKAGLSE